MRLSACGNLVGLIDEVFRVSQQADFPGCPSVKTHFTFVLVKVPAPIRWPQIGATVLTRSDWTDTPFRYKKPLTKSRLAIAYQTTAFCGGQCPPLLKGGLGHRVILALSLGQVCLPSVGGPNLHVILNSQQHHFFVQAGKLG